MGREKKNGVFGRQGTGSALFGILTVLFACVFSQGVLSGCGRGTETEFSLERESGQAPSEAPESAADQELSDLCVHVCGAVNEPGLLRLPEGSRIYDALEAAGGFAPEADTSALNLAAKLTDGQQLYFPVLGEAVREPAESGGKVNINTADERELCTLTGIGSSRAQAILEYRSRQGAFESIEDLMKVPGIKESVFEKICDKIMVK